MLLTKNTHKKGRSFIHFGNNEAAGLFFAQASRWHTSRIDGAWPNDCRRRLHQARVRDCQVQDSGHLLCSV